MVPIHADCSLKQRRIILRLSKYERGERAEKSTLKPVIPASNRSLKPLAHSKVHPFLSKTWAKQH